MSEWWSYQPRDLLMFSPETYYRLFELYNADIWPAQILTLAAGLAILGLLLRPTQWAGRAIATVLAVAWAFVAFAYFSERYAAINLAAPTYAWLFAAQSLLLLIYGAGFGKLAVGEGHSRAVGTVLVAFGVLLQPLVGPLTGHAWSGVELFGVVPDPTVTVTLGVLLAGARMRWMLLPIPLLWCAITGVTLETMGSPEALLMPAVGAGVLLFGLYRALARKS